MTGNRDARAPCCRIAQRCKGRQMGDLFGRDLEVISHAVLKKIPLLPEVERFIEFFFEREPGAIKFAGCGGVELECFDERRFVKRTPDVPRFQTERPQILFSKVLHPD